MQTFTHCKNLGPHSALNGNIYTQGLCNGSTPSVSHLRAFGCQAWATRPGVLRRKLDPKVESHIFIGYELGKKAYRMYIPNTQSMMISGIKPTLSNHCLYCLHNLAGHHHITLYVENLLFASALLANVNWVKAALHFKLVSET